ncbi:MAG: pyridoxamine 5'-phosphate oxidase family protein [Atopobiaceae bacterium]|nr:pyridoxamine 5'-phosphate oxidase family protein [Atopobiaceae bacterium]
MFRKMRRHAQQLDLEKDQQILAEVPRGVFSVLGDDNYPYGFPINFVYDPTQGELGSIFFHAALEGHKLDALAAHDKASFCVIDDGYQNEGEWWKYFHSVICFGRASIVDDPQRKHDGLVKLASKYFPPEIDIEADILKNGERIHLVELKIEHMTGKHVQEK